MSLDKRLLFLWLVFIAFASLARDANEPKTFKIYSPSKNIRVNISVSSNKELFYSVNAGAQSILENSPLGISIDGNDLGKDVAIIASPKMIFINERYSILGNHREAFNHANEAVFILESHRKQIDLILRVYDDGVAIRYTLPDDAKHIDKESTTWNLSAGVKNVAWSDFSRVYENLSHITSLDKLPEDTFLMAPITCEMGNKFLSISEADCENFSDMCFIREGNSFKTVFPFAKQGWDVKDSSGENKKALAGIYLNKKASPWRTLIIANNLTELINSDLLTNLCPAPTMDFSWVQPGRCLWQWWSVGKPKYEDQKDWYNAAAKLKWEYYLIDAGWREWKTQDKDQWQLLKEVIDYGKSVGVKTLVWVDSKEMRNATDRRTYLERIKSIGGSGIKIDFNPPATAKIMKWYMGAMQDCAELKLLLNFHGAVKPTGLRRTYPNDITREAVRGNEWHMTKYKRVAPLDFDVSLPFTRSLAGPADVTPVMLDPKELTTQKFTWPHELAQAIVVLSPVTHFADQYKFYLESPMLDLFQTMPTVWDETKVLSCTIMGEVVAYARRKGNAWWIGVMNGATEKEVQLPLTMLQKKGAATLVSDDPVNNTSIKRYDKTVNASDTLTIKLSAGGGFVARIIQQ